MSPHTALRAAITAGRPAVLIARRSGGIVHVLSWSGAQAPVTAKGRVLRGFRPMCGSRGRGWQLALHVDVDARLCGRCDAAARPLLPTSDIPAGLVADAELPALIAGCRTARQLEQTRAHVLTPWRGQLRATGLRGEQVTVLRLFGQVRDRINGRPAERHLERMHRAYAAAIAAEDMR